MYKKTCSIILASLLTACTINAPGTTAPGGTTTPTDGSSRAPGGSVATPGQGLHANEPSRDIAGRPIVEHSGTIEADETWGPDQVHVIKGELYIQGSNSPTVTILPGTVVRIGNEGSIWVGYNGRGGLVAKGTAEAPIRFTSDAPTPAHGDWQTIGFYKGNLSAKSALDHAIVEYGGANDYGNIYLNETTLKIANSELRHSASYGLKGESNAHVEGFTGSSLQGNKKAVVYWSAASAHELSASNNYKGNTIDRVYLKAETVERSATWQALNVPYQLNGELYVQGDASPVLTLQSGLQLLMGNDAALWVGYNGRGGLKAIGTDGAPITITSDAPTPSAGDWKAIGFYGGTIADSQLVHTTVAYGGSDASYGMIYVAGGAELTLDQATLSHSKTAALKVDAEATLTAMNVEFEANQGGDRVDAD